MAAPLSLPEVQFVVKCLTLGDMREEVIAKFTEKFGHSIWPATVTRIKKRNLDAITKGKLAIIGGGAASAAMLRHKSYTLIERKLDRALNDDSAIQEMNQEFRDGDITQAEYDRKLKTYEAMTINELTAVAKTAHEGMKGEDGDPVTPQDQAAFQMLLAGIKSGNPVQLVQLLNPTIHQTLESLEASPLP